MIVSLGSKLVPIGLTGLDGGVIVHPIIIKPNEPKKHAYMFFDLGMASPFWRIFGVDW